MWKFYVVLLNVRKRIALAKATWTDIRGSLKDSIWEFEKVTFRYKTGRKYFQVNRPL